MSTANEENFEDELLSQKTPCQTIVTLEGGERILKDKIKHRSEAQAKRRADKHNLKKTSTEMVAAYECSECGHWHIGRNGKKLDAPTRAKLLDDRVKVKVVGFIDLTKFEKKKKPTAEEVAEKKKKEEAKKKKAEARKEKNRLINTFKNMVKSTKMKRISLEELKNNTEG